MTDWQPTATMETLRQRAGMLAAIRQFFALRDVLEVDVPVLAETGVTDLHIDCIEARVSGRTHYLQSSPEYFMKRLLAAGSGSIYCLGKAFRNGEVGHRHNPEFTMLEWYRTGWDEHQLMAEVVELMGSVAAIQGHQKLSYGDIFSQLTGLNPHCCELAELQLMTASLSGGDFASESRSTCLDLIFSLAVEPELPGGLVLVYNYPACQSALAQLDKDKAGATIARRFEAFVDGVELANGYFELTDPVEQQTRFDADIALRKAAGKPPVPVDKKLLAAMASGLPGCAGVALGVDRLLMQLLKVRDIKSVIPFG